MRGRADLHRRAVRRRPLLPLQALPAFCADCGSHTHTISPDDPTLVAIRLGCLDQDPGIRPQAHQFVAYASPLEPLPDDGLPRFPERLGTAEPLGPDGGPAAR